MKLILALTLILGATLGAQAYIPRGFLILQKTADNGGAGIYQIEQEVQFQSATESLLIKETWIVENENNMRVWVQGTKDLKNKISFVATYSAGNRNGGLGSGRVSSDFFERYFHFRNAENFANELISAKVVPTSIFNKKAYRSTKDVESQSEDFVRLGRSGGSVTYIFSTAATETNPSLWIEQDQFVVRKIRLPSQAEVTAEKFGSYSRGLNFPRYRSVRWGDNQVQITTLSVQSKGKDALALITNKIPTQLEGLNNSNLKANVEEFYKRFR